MGQETNRLSALALVIGCSLLFMLFMSKKSCADPMAAPSAPGHEVHFFKEARASAVMNSHEMKYQLSEAVILGPVNCIPADFYIFAQENSLFWPWHDTFGLLDVGFSSAPGQHIIMSASSGPFGADEKYPAPNDGKRSTAIFPIPEPSTLFLFSTGLLALAGLKSPKKKDNKGCTSFA